jgi:UDP-3-O-[3-hydroxymyristoyl] glucosamine N-acyltransferase
VQYELGELAVFLEVELTDHTQTRVNVFGARSLDAAGPGDIAFLWDNSYVAAAKTCRASAVIAREAAAGLTCIVVDDPQAAMLTLLGQVYRTRHPELPSGVHATAFVSQEATLGEGVAVGPGAVIEAGANIGARTQVRGRAYVGCNVTIGDDCHVYPSATILDRCQLGDRVTVWSGAVIGKDGFGFLQREGKHARIPHVGNVIIKDDVEIGALSTVARGAMENTIIGNGVIIDDHCHVAHNCEIGDHTVICGRTAMGGSVKVGKNVFLLQDSGISNGRSVGDGAIVGSSARVIHKDLGPGEKTALVATSYTPITAKKIQLTLPELPGMRLRLKKLEKRVDELSKAEH